VLNLYDYFQSHQIEFSLVLEATSLLLIAPLTARVVAFQEKLKWKNIRKFLAADIISDVFKITRELELFYRNIATAIEYRELLQERFERILNTRPSDQIEYSYDDESFSIKFLNTYELIPLESPLKNMEQFGYGIQALIRCNDAINDLEHRITKYSFCLSPDMLVSINRFFSLKKPSANKKLIERPTINTYGVGGSSTLFLRFASITISSLHTAVNFFNSNKHYAETSEGRNILLNFLNFVYEIDFQELAENIEDLISVSGLKKSLDENSISSIKQLKDKSKNLMFRQSINGFRDYLTNFEALTKEFNEMKEIAIKKYSK